MSKWWHTLQENFNLDMGSSVDTFQWRLYLSYSFCQFTHTLHIFPTHTHVHKTLDGVFMRHALRSSSL